MSDPHLDFADVPEATDLETAAGDQAVERWITLAGHVICLRFGSPLLATTMTASLRHLSIDPRDRADLTICAWDGQSGGRRWGPRPSGSVRDGEIWLAREGNRAAAFRPSESIVYALDRSTATGAFWLPDSRCVPFDERMAPFRHLLAWWFRPLGPLVLHSAAIGTANGMVLLGGSNNAGKSTTSVVCLQAGLTFGGDNYCLIDDDGAGGFRLSTMYSSASLRLPHWRRYPELLDTLDPMPDEGAGKVSVQLDPEGAFARDATVVAVAVPQVSPDRIAVEPLPPREALVAFSSNAITPLVGRDPDAFAFAARLLRSLPFNRLTVTPDFDRIPDAIREVLTAAVVRGGR